MNENREVQARSRRSMEEIKRLVLEFEASGLRGNELCRSPDLAVSIQDVLLDILSLIVAVRRTR